MRKYIFAVVMLMFIAGCSPRAIDSFDSCVAAGSPVIESYPRQCTAGNQTFVEEVCTDGNGNSMSLDEAKRIAKASECGDRLVLDCTCPQGYRKEGDACNPSCYYSTPRCLSPSIVCEKSFFCNEGTGTYWINMDVKKEGCSPACVVSLASKTAEINWRCTGLITE